eukprot:scaffold9245_cov78-Phaeocystis_antarctica.AAC.4
MSYVSLHHGVPLGHDVDIGAARPDLRRLLAVQPPREHVPIGRHSKYSHSKHGHSKYSHSKCSHSTEHAPARRQLLRDGHQVRHHAQRPVARAPALVRVGVRGEGAGGHCAAAGREAGRVSSV